MKPLSPFQDVNKDKAPEIAQSFSFQTMQGDLLGAPKSTVLVPDKTKETITNDPFLIDKKNITPPQNTEKVIAADLSKNPFFTPVATETTAKKDPITPSMPLAQKAIITEAPLPEEFHSESSSPAYKSIVYIIIILIILITTLGGYYFWLSRTPKTAPAAIEPVVETPIINPVVEEPVAEPIVIQAPVEKYSTEKPNYLTIDPSTMSAEEIKTAISAVAVELKDSSSLLPYEFILVDTNNNQISFPIFAATAKLNFSQALLTLLDEKFSLFIYNDNTNARIGLSVSTLKAKALSSELLKQEKTLVSNASLLFLDTVPEIKTGAFSTSEYKNHTIHYLNLNQQKNLSIDYTITNSQFILSTSKNMQRAVLDKLNSKEVMTKSTPLATIQESPVSIPGENDPQIDSTNLANTDVAESAEENIVR